MLRFRQEKKWIKTTTQFLYLELFPSTHAEVMRASSHVSPAELARRTNEKKLYASIAGVVTFYFKVYH